MNTPQLVCTEKYGLALTVESQAKGWQLHVLGNAVVLNQVLPDDNVIQTCVLHCGSFDTYGQIEGTATYQAPCAVVYHVKARCGDDHIATMNAMLVLMQGQP